MSGGFRPAAVWDPILIISNIVCIQCAYYAAFGLQTLVISLFISGGNRHPPVEAIFDHSVSVFISLHGSQFLTLLFNSL